MFEQICKAPYALARHRQSPLAEQRQRYLEHRAKLGMSPGVQRASAGYLLAITEYLRLAERPDDLITTAEIEIMADRWAKRSSRRPQTAGGRETRKRFIMYATDWLKFMKRWQPPVEAPRPYADKVAAFVDHMRREQGFSEKTVELRSRIVQQFLDCLCASRRLDEITPTHVDNALLEKLHKSKHARTSVSIYAHALRAFFRYAQSQHWCQSGLAETIQSPRVFSHDKLPSGPSWDDVQRLLATTEGDAPSAIRNRAILLLLAIYGCRAGSVVRLRLEDLDWQRELIHFPRLKSSRPRTFPLSRPVGNAILRYLKEVRPRSPYREVFLRLSAPFTPLTTDALWALVSQRLRALGLSLHHYGPHALRHACATHLLEQGFTLKQIGDHLGHRDPDTTRLYAKVNLPALRQVADFNLGELI